MVTNESSETATMTSLEVRQQLVRALRLDLVGPGPGDELAEELLPGWVRPSNWYLTGFLIPSGTPVEQSADADEDDEVGETPDDAGLAEENSEEGKAAKKGFFPSSMGLSFLVPGDARRLSVAVRWGEYARDEIEGQEGKMLDVWRRTPRERVVEIALDDGDAPQTSAVPDSKGLELQSLRRCVAPGGLDGGIPAGTCSVSIFLVNRRAPSTERPDADYVFQPELEIRSDLPFVPRPDLRGAGAQDWDEQVADLHYTDTPEYATGLGVSADWDLVDETCRAVRTAWIPSAEVEKTATADVPGVELSMRTLGALADGAAAEAALAALVSEYRAWIIGHQKTLGHLTPSRTEAADELLRLAGIAADRIERGIAVLKDDPDVLDAFRVANRAVGAALRRRLKDVDDPKWRAFQLAFFLLNLPGIADPSDPQREIADLLFFPTGGGKTEAYLGLAAFTMVMRRLRHQDSDGALRGWRERHHALYVAPADA